MKLTQEELAKIRSWYDAQLACGIYPHDTGKLLDFAETMLPIRDALIALLNAEARTNSLLGEGNEIPEGTEVDESFVAQEVAHKTFWDLARELGKTDADKGADDV